MKIFDNIELIDLGIYTNKTLIFSDFHVGYEESLNKQGVFVPRFQFNEIIKRLDKLFLKLKRKKIERIIVNGDIKHEFGNISEQEWRHTLYLLDYFSKRCEEVILVKGNHDKILGPIAEKRNVKVVEYYMIDPLGKNTIKNNGSNEKNPINKKNSKKEPINKLKIINIRNSINKIIEDNKSLKKTKIINKKNNKNKNLKNKILVIHGDKLPDKEILKGVLTVIIGHEHPAVSIKDTIRAEKFKSYLLGKWKGKNLIVQPSFNLVTEGTDVAKEKLLSPFLKRNIRNFKAVIVADKLYGFGKVGSLE